MEKHVQKVWMTKLHLSRKDKMSKSPDNAVVSGNQIEDHSFHKPRLGTWDFILKINGFKAGSNKISITLQKHVRRK